MQQPRKARIGVFVALVLILVAFVSAAVTMIVSNRLGADKNAALAELFDMVETHALTKVTEDELYTGAARGAVGALDDDYAEYFTAKEYADSQETKSGRYKGIGLTFSEGDEGLVVVSVNESGPAARAGVKAGDLILAADGEALTGMTTNEVADVIKSKEGEFVMEFSREGNTYTVKLACEEIISKRVAYRLLDEGVAYIHLNAFYGTAASEFQDALKQAETDGAKGAVLDLRENLGGDLTEMMDIADRLLDDKLVLTIKNGDGTEEIHRTSAGATDIHMVVLVNGNSASASEALTGALTDHGRAVVVGTQTYGKGIVQTTYPLKNGDYVKLTTGEYFTPNGVSIHKKGITPDVIVDLAEGEAMNLTGESEYDTQLRAAVDELLKVTG